ncbi:MAG TPA: PIN domain-containing protein [Pirellulales bacterium]|nr:PIN domain-containing protein [Pirellulales bacterium]
MTFVDTGAWFSAVVPNDPSHSAVVAALSEHGNALLTTDYVLDETLTLLKRRGETERAIRLGKRLLEENSVRLEWVGQQDAVRAWILFQQHADKDWSFTDCASFAVIQRLSIKTVIALDHHFRQFGALTVLP